MAFPTFWMDLWGFPAVLGSDGGAALLGCLPGVGRGCLTPQQRNLRNAHVEFPLQASCATALLGLRGEGQSVGLLLYQVFKKIQIDLVLIQKHLKFADNLFFLGTFNCTGYWSVCHG